MAYCKKCGTLIDDNAYVCPACGASQQDAPQAAPQTYQQAYPQTNPQPVDNGGFGWGILGFCIPIVGLILFLVWKDQKPNSSKAAGIGALVGVIIGVVGYIILIIAGVALGSTTGSSSWYY